MLDLKKIDNNWTLFLDRDGVINRDKPNDYIYNTGEFIFYDGVLDALRQFRQQFGHIVIVTNQKGVGRGLMTETDLNDIHTYMLKQIEQSGGHIDKIYYCIATDNDDPDRKPNPGMAHRAKLDFPAIDFSRSLIIGNNVSDMEFGRNTGIHTVFIRSTQPELPLPHPHIDASFNSLADFAKALQAR